MTRPIVRNRRSGQHAIDRLQRPEYFRSATDRFIRIGSLKHGQFSRLFARISHVATLHGVYPHLPFTSPVVYCYTTKLLYILAVLRYIYFG
jgi:hypothetical protein